VLTESTGQVDIEVPRLNNATERAEPDRKKVYLTLLNKLSDWPGFVRHLLKRRIPNFLVYLPRNLATVTPILFP